MKKTKDTIADTTLKDLTVETIEVTPDDGFVDTREFRPMQIREPGIEDDQYIYGYAKTKVYTTSDPRIIRFFVYSFSGLFFVIGAFVFLFGRIFSKILLGIPFMFVAYILFVDTKKDLEKKENENLKQADVNKSVPEELESIKKQIEEDAQVTKEFVNDVKDDFEETTKEFLTKDKYDIMVKLTIKLLIVLGILMFVLFTWLVNIFLGIFILLAIAAGGFGYIRLLKLIFNQ